jgi:hypothetical protein
MKLSLVGFGLSSNKCGERPGRRLGAAVGALALLVAAVVVIAMEIVGRRR